jgi:molybdate transport system ATP-binding protein
LIQSIFLRPLRAFAAISLVPISLTAQVMPRKAPLIELHHCSLILDDQPILDDVSFELRAGERWALIGANGSGKTMLLKMIRGDMWPTPTGNERRIYRLDGTTAAPAGSKQRIAYLGSERQDKYVRYDWDLTVRQVVTTGLFDEDIPLTTPSAAQRAKVDRMMKRFGVWGIRSRQFLTLSYGQRRLTLVARAFVSSAKVLLLDEVFNGLDIKAKDKLRKALEQPREVHAWIITSHRPHELPGNVTNVARVEKGRLVIGDGAVSRHDPSHSVRPEPVHAGFPLVIEGLLKPGGTLRQTQGERKKNRAGSAPTAPFALSKVEAIGKASRYATRRSANAWLVKISNTDLYRDYRPVIRNLNWTIERGENWAVLGANGSGKSTVLSLIYGDLHPALGGTVQRRGLTHGTHIATWKHRVGWVSPELQADHYLATSLEEIVITGRYSSVGLNDAPTAADRRAATRWLRFFGIEHLRDRGPRQVSYGQMRLALIARAMVNQPELLLLDEPCTGLDGDVRKHVLDVLQRIAESGTQLIMAVHDETDIVPAIENALRIGPRLQASVAKRPD